MWEQPVDKTGNEKDEVEELHPCKTEEPLENRSFKEECDYAVKLFENGNKQCESATEKSAGDKRDDKQYIIISNQTGKDDCIMYEAEFADGKRSWIHEDDIDEIALDNFCQQPEKRKYNLRSRKKHIGASNINMMLCTLMVLNVVRALVPPRVRIELGRLYRCDTTRKLGLFAFEDQEICPRGHKGPLSYKPSVFQYQPTERIINVYLCRWYIVDLECETHFFGDSIRRTWINEMKTIPEACRESWRTKESPHGHKILKKSDNHY